MKVKQIKENIEGRKDEEEIFVVWYDQEEATTLLVDLAEEEEIKEITGEEWERVVNCMNNDDAIWNELSESFKYFIEEIIKERVKNDNSK